MIKYWLFIKNSFQTNFVYRFNTFGYLFSEFLSLGVTSYVLLSVYHQGGQMNNYTLSGLIFYFLMSKFLNMTVSSNDMVRVVGDEIYNGDFINSLIRPISYRWAVFCVQLGNLAYSLLVYGILFIALYFVFLQNFALDPTRILLFILATGLSFLLGFFIYFSISMSAFYFDNIMGVSFTSYTLMYILSGNLLPLDLMPKYLAVISGYLPFQYLTFIPISILNNNIPAGDVLITLLPGVIWLFAFYLFFQFLFNRGTKRYEAYGR